MLLSNGRGIGTCRTAHGWSVRAASPRFICLSVI